MVTYTVAASQNKNKKEVVLNHIFWTKATNSLLPHKQEETKVSLGPGVDRVFQNVFYQNV